MWPRVLARGPSQGVAAAGARTGRILELDTLIDLPMRLSRRVVEVLEAGVEMRASQACRITPCHDPKHAMHRFGGGARVFSA
jgi:hypothetical protein